MPVFPPDKINNAELDKIEIKDLQLNVLLEITNAINQNLSTLEVLEKYQNFIRDELKIAKLVLYNKGRRWRPLLDYGLTDEELDNIDVEEDLLQFTKIESLNSSPNKHLAGFDMVVPVLRGDQPIAYLVLGDQDDEALSVSVIIKHLNYLQILTNIVVSAIENQRLSKEALKKEQEKQKLIAEQNEMLEEQVAERTTDLRKEKDESERLLNNILP
ncbi:MAG: hypothetical protein IH969_05775, partial [Candidatus Krumholzibacteriota bacterium]|nr:hypothetical protein [Candidatus Krumholzibacteriota bacterium]